MESPGDTRYCVKRRVVEKHLELGNRHLRRLAHKANAHEEIRIRKFQLIANLFPYRRDLIQRRKFSEARHAVNHNCLQSGTRIFGDFGSQWNRNQHCVGANRTRFRGRTRTRKIFEPQNFFPFFSESFCRFDLIIGRRGAHTDQNSVDSVPANRVSVLNWRIGDKRDSLLFQKRDSAILSFWIRKPKRLNSFLF